MANRHMAVQALGRVIAREIIANEAKMALRMENLAVKAGNAASLLATMLQGVHAESGQGGGIINAENAKDATFFAKLIFGGVKYGLGRVNINMGHRFGSPFCGG
jgi:hypothetical protein